MKRKNINTINSTGSVSKTKIIKKKKFEDHEKKPSVYALTDIHRISLGHHKCSIECCGVSFACCKYLVAKPKINITINDLNDDCLIQMFKYLPYQDRLNIELISNKWNDLGKQSWANVTSLDLSKDKKYNYLLYPDEKRNTTLVINILKRSRQYINIVCIEENSVLNYSLIFNELLNCQNIKNLSLKGSYNWNRKFCTEDNLSLLFKNNANLSSVFIKGLFTVGKSLLNLKSNKLKALSFEFYEFKSGNYFSCFSKFENLEKLEVFVKKNPNETIAALSSSGCKNINELILTGNEKLNLNQLSSFISRQKDLTKLSIQEPLINIPFLESLAVEKIKYLDISISNYKEAFSCLKHFKNLLYFVCEVGIITDKSIKDLIKCINLRKLEIKVHDKSYLSLAGINCLSALKGLESFKFVDLDIKNVDDIVSAISKCKNLKELNILGALFTEKSLNSIYLIPGLEILNFSVTDITNEDVLKLINKSLNLKELHIWSCKLVDCTIFKDVNSLKLRRGDTNILKIYFNNKIKFYDKNINFQKFQLVILVELRSII